MRVAVRVTGLAVAAAGLVAAAIGWQPRGVQAQSGPAPNTVAFYNQRVQPILSNNCYRCHGGENHRGRLHMDTRAELLAGGHDGVVIVPGHPEQSLLVKLIRHEGPEDDPMPMPPKSKLSDADIETISEWIKGGAVMP
jgi:cytochrome c553